MKQLLFLSLCGSMLLFSCKKNDQRPVAPVGTDTISSEAPDPMKYLLLASRQHNSSNSTGYMSLVCYDENSNVKWSRTDLGQTWDLLTSKTPQYYNNIVYFSTDSLGVNRKYLPSFFAIDINTGQDIWSKKNTQQEYMRNPIVRNDILYCGYQKNAASYIAAYNALNGTQLWTVPVPEKFGPAELQLKGDTLYFVTSTAGGSSIVNSFNLTTKTFNWKAGIGLNFNGQYSSLAIHNGIVTLTNGTGSLLGLDIATGATVWSKPGITQMYIVNNLIYCNDRYGFFYAINPLNGNTLHTSFGIHCWDKGQ